MMESVQFRDADDLYSNLSVEHVWLVLDSTREQVEHKRSELRALIGGRYHELIDSADAIVGMGRTVEAFKAEVSAVEARAAGLLDSSALTGARPASPAVARQEAGQAKGRLLDQADALTQAAVKIWESLDANELWPACEIFLEARAAHEALCAEARAGSPAAGAPEAAAPPPPASALEDLERLGFGASEAEAMMRELAPPAAAAPQRAGERPLLELYPYLRSHWSLVEQACGKIVQQATLTLRTKELPTETTRGALHALLVLDDVTAEESLARLLAARSELVRGLLSSAPADAAGDAAAPASDPLAQALTAVLDTVVDVAKLYLPEEAAASSGELKVEPAAVRSAVSAWVEAEAAAVGPVARQLLQRARSVDELCAQQRELLSIEQSGGASADAGAERDAATWTRSYQACVAPALYQGAAGGLFLYALFFSSAVVERATELLERAFCGACDELRERTALVLSPLAAAEAESDEEGSLEPTSKYKGVAWYKRAKKWAVQVKVDGVRRHVGYFSDELEAAEAYENAVAEIQRQRAADGKPPVAVEPGELEANPQDDPDEAAERLAALAARIVSEEALARARVAAQLLVAFGNQLGDIDASRERLTGGANAPELDAQLRGRCGAVLEALVAALEQALETYAERFEQGVARLVGGAQGDDNLVDFLKRALFVARVAEALGVQAPLLGRLVEAELLARATERLEGMARRTHGMFADLTLALSRGVLQSCLQGQDWTAVRDWRRLHSGWERINIHLAEGGDPLDDDADGLGLDDSGDDAAGDDDADNDDIVLLPGTVSPGAAMFSFLLTKQIRIVGDSRFVLSPAMLLPPAEGEDAAAAAAAAAEAQTPEQRAWRQEFLRGCVRAFCESSRAAVLQLADKGSELVHDLYAAHLAAHEDTPNEAAALQTVFDLHWFEWLLCVERPGGVRNRMAELVDSVLEGQHIDPINWTIYEPLLMARVKSYRERNALLFGPMLMVKAHFARSSGSSAMAASAETSVAYDSNNVLHLGFLGNNTAARIPLLPIPSTIRSIQHKRSMQRKRTTSNSRALLTSASAAGASRSAAVPDDAASALRAMGQVGSNLFSQASSWLQR